MASQSLERLLESLAGTVTVQGNRVVVADANRLPDRMNGLIYEAVFGDAQSKAAARWLIWETAQAVGIRPASIHELYMARGRGDCGCQFTVPAMNLRMMAYDSARAVFRAARKLNAGALIFEIARSEMSYTDQRPAEYVSSVLAAAIKEGYRGPVFIQGDHFQAGAKKYAAAPEVELKAIRDLIVEAVAAGFYNIDIDTSTLVDLSKLTLEEQQRLNFELCADLTRFIRGHESKGITISVGGEIGEVGTKNSTPEDLHTFMRGYNDSRGSVTGISKISIKTGTSHGGVVLADGTLANVAIDFDVLRTISELARKEYGMGGAVQHGASTLPENAFHKFVEAGACEVHLATAFQTLIMEHEATPETLRQEMYEWLHVNAADERKPKDTDAQFFYKSRKKAVGPFKKSFWTLPDDARAAIGASLEKQFDFLFEQLGIGGTADIVAQFVHAPEIHRPMPSGGVKTVKGESVEGLAD
jgi:fructose-bisphosphate aldolase, class II